MRSKSKFLVQGHTKVTDHRRENKMRKIGSKGNMSNLASCWRVPSQINLVLRELRRSRLDDIQVPKASMAMLIARTVAAYCTLFCKQLKPQIPGGASAPHCTCLRTPLNHRRYCFSTIFSVSFRNILLQVNFSFSRTLHFIGFSTRL